jgi:hypothetical protein
MSRAQRELERLRRILADAKRLATAPTPPRNRTHKSIADCGVPPERMRGFSVEGA